MDNERTKSTNETVTEKYTSDIVYVSELVKNYEHALIKRDDRIEKLQSEMTALEQNISYIKDRLFECSCALQVHTKQLTKSELVEKMKYCYSQLLEIKELF